MMYQHKQSNTVSAWMIIAGLTFTIGFSTSAQDADPANSCAQISPASMDNYANQIGEALKWATADAVKNGATGAYAVAATNSRDLLKRAQDRAIAGANALRSADPSVTTYAEGGMIKEYIRSILEVVPQATHWAIISAVYHKSTDARQAFEGGILVLQRGDELFAATSRCYMDAYMNAITPDSSTSLDSSASAQLLHVPFDGSVAPGTIYESATCKPVEDAMEGYPCVKYVEGHSGQAIEFGKYSAVAAPLTLDPRDHPQLTITAWIKRPRSGGTGGAIVNTGGGGGLPYLSLYSGSLAASGGRQFVRHLEELGGLPGEEWVLVAGVWDFDARTLRLHQGIKHASLSDLPMYLDPDLGKVISVHPTFAAPGGDGEKRSYVFIGSQDFKGFGSTALTVAIDDVRIYDRALSIDEINSMASDTGSSIEPLPLPVMTGETGENLSVPESSSGETTSSSTPFPIGEVVALDSGTLLENSNDPLAEARAADEERRKREEFQAIADQNQEDLLAAAAEEEAQAQAEAEAVQPSGETETVTSALEAAKPRPDGAISYTAVSGFEGDIQVTLDLEDEFISGIAWDEFSDRPCGIAPMVGGSISMTQVAKFKCDEWFPRPEIKGEHKVSLFGWSDAIIGRIEVCNNDRSNQRLKGIKIWGDTINDDGSTTFNPATAAEVLPNCANSNWGLSVLCPSGKLATGIVVHANDLGGDTKAEIVGLQLVCRGIEMR